MMNVMVVSVVPTEHLKRVPWEVVSTVVVHGLERRDAKEEHGLSRVHSSERLCNGCSEAVQKEALNRVVVQRPKGVWDV